jgi:hypothetical protein
MKTKALLIALAPIFAMGACAKPAGGPLGHTFDNAKIASVPLEQKQAVVQAQQQYDLAQATHTDAEARYRDSEIEEDLANYQAEHSLVVSHIAANHVAASTPVATADSAALARKTADAKVAFMRSRHDWLGKLSDSSLYTAYAAQAKLELERARTAQSNNLAAAGFDLGPYQRQFDERDAAAKTAVAATDTERKTADAKLSEWTEMERSFMKAGNLTGPLESERFAAEWKKMESKPMAPPPAEPTVPTKPEPAPAPASPAPTPST